MSQQAKPQHEWRKSLNKDGTLKNEFESWNNWDTLPEAYKPHIKRIEGWKSNEDEEKEYIEMELAKLTNGKRYMYGVNIDKRALDLGYEILNVWRLPRREWVPEEQYQQQQQQQQSGTGTGSSTSTYQAKKPFVPFKKEFPPSIQIDLEVCEESIAQARLLENRERKSFTDPVWELRNDFTTMVNGTEKRLFTMIKKAKFGNYGPGPTGTGTGQ